MIQILQSHLRAASRFMPRHDLRYYLNGVKVTATETQTQLVTTDGHRMLVVRHETENSTTGEFIMPAPLVSELTKGRRTKNKISITSLGKNKFQASLPRTHQQYAAIFEFEDVGVEEYPDWRKVLPNVFSWEVAQFNPKYISDAAQAFKDVLGVSGHSPRICHNGDSAAVLAHEDTEDIVCIVMPFKHLNNPTSLVPAWALEAKKEFENRGEAV